MIEIHPYDVEFIAHVLIDQLDSRGHEMLDRRPAMTYLEFHAYQDPLIFQARSLFVKLDQLEEFNKRMKDEIEGMFTK